MRDVGIMECGLYTLVGMVNDGLECGEIRLVVFLILQYWQVMAPYLHSVFEV